MYQGLQSSVIIGSLVWWARALATEVFSIRGFESSCLLFGLQAHPRLKKVQMSHMVVQKQVTVQKHSEHKYFPSNMGLNPLAYSFGFKPAQ
jgi:hypothetical protein